MSTIYIVTSGCYSDYHIDAVFSTKEKAEEYIDINGSSEMEIEEHDIDEPIEKFDKLYCVVFKMMQQKRVDFDICHSTFYEDGMVMYSDYFDRTILYVKSDSARRAVKVATERYMQIKAQPYLFPYLKKKCVKRTWGRVSTYDYPTYNFYTSQIILRNGEELVIEK